MPGVRLYVMRNGCGDTVARTTLHAHAVFDAKLGRSLQLFGLTESASTRSGMPGLLDDQAAPSMMSEAAVACWTGSLLSPRRTLCIDSARVWPARR